MTRRRIPGTDAIGRPVPDVAEAFASVRTMPETTWQRVVAIPLLHRLGYRVHAVWRSDTAHFRGADEGWPDLFAVRPPRAVAIELKSATGDLSPEQAEWGELLARVPGIEHLVVRIGPDTTALEEYLR